MVSAQLTLLTVLVITYEKSIMMKLMIPIIASTMAIIIIVIAMKLSTIIQKSEN